MGKQARNIARQQRLAQAATELRRARRNRVLAIGGGLVIIGLLIAIVVTVVNAAGGTTSTEEATPPAGVTAAGAIPVGDPAAPVRLEVYLDYLCPYCGRFDRTNAAEVSRLVAAGQVRLELYPLSFLDKASNGTRYSTRAANAVATVADRAPGKVLVFSQALYAQQPEEGSDGLTDSQIAKLAESVGISKEITSTFASRTYEPWISKSTSAAFAGGVTGTPTVKINGTVFKGDLYTVGPLTEAITAAKDQ